MYGLADCNNFYASCERMFAPDLNGRPVVVLSNNDGCIIARSDEAKPSAFASSLRAMTGASLPAAMKQKRSV